MQKQGERDERKKDTLPPPLPSLASRSSPHKGVQKVFRSTITITPPSAGP